MHCGSFPSHGITEGRQDLLAAEHVIDKRPSTAQTLLAEGDAKEDGVRDELSQTWIHARSS